ncbi:MAG: radical SAM family heme chaperone HemW [Caulobacterales bacterium]
MTDAAPGGAPPIGLYVHWPYCARLCPYCDFNIYRDRGRRDEQTTLVAAILADLRTQAARAGRRRLVSIFFGGGTPSLMDPPDVAAIVAAAQAQFTADARLEVTLEANPTDAEAARFAALAQAGVTRLSLGVQSLDDAALTFLGRNHDAAAARRAAEVAVRAFPRLSIDLIYARPGQSVAAWRGELSEALELGAEHVSPYQLTIEAGTAFDRAVRRGAWSPPDEDLAAELFEATGEVLGAAGLEAYEVSNHARGSAARSRHNLLYWRGEDYLGLGPGAHGRLTVAGARWASLTAARPATYVSAVAAKGDGLVAWERLSDRDAALERLLMGLRTVEGVPLPDLAPLAIDGAVIAGFSDQGLLVQSGGRLIATSRGRSVLDRLTLELVGAGVAG